MTRPKELQEQQAPILDQIVALNKKYKFSQTKRSDEDQQRSTALWDEMCALDDAYDAKHPLENCELCGGPRYASLGGSCMNVARCDNAPRFIGG